MKAEFSDEQFQESMRVYLIKGADEIRQKLNLTERNFQFMSRAFNGRGRRHYIYEVLNEVEQLAMALDILDEILGEIPENQIEDDTGERIFRNSFELIEREQSLHLRRLTELLVYLINFSQTNSNEYYDHYFLYQELNQRKKKKHDYKAYYGSENLNNNYAIDSLVQSITWAETKIALNKCWYLAGNNPEANGKAKPESFDMCFRKALRVATVSEKIALRFSYNQAYGETSQSIHSGIGRIKSVITYEGLKGTNTLLFSLAMHCLLRCQKLLGLKNRKGIIPEIVKALKMSDKAYKKLYNQYVRPEIKRGDFVVVSNSLFEVLGSAKGEFGYKSFKLKYLTKPHIPEIDVEWFAAYNIVKFQDGKRMRDNVIKMLTIDGQKPNLDPKKLRQTMRKVIIKYWTEYIDAIRNR
jgi:hypothetical protein